MFKCMPTETDVSNHDWLYMYQSFEVGTETGPMDKPNLNYILIYVNESKLNLKYNCRDLSELSL